MILDPLKPEDIDEKIKANADVGIDLAELSRRLKAELKQRKWEHIKNQINIQSLSEQIEHIDAKLAEAKNNA